MLDDLKEEKKITKSSEQKLKEITEFYKEVLDNIVNGVWVTDKNDIIKYTNKAMEIIAGIPRESIVGVRVLKDFPEFTLKFFRPYYLKAKATLKPKKYDSVPVQTPSNRESFQSGWLIPVVEDEQFEGMICTVEDVTDRKIAEQKIKDSEEKLRFLNKELELRVEERTKKLKESEEKYKELFNHMSSGVAVYEAVNDGEDFIFIDFNFSGEKIENIKKENVIGKSVLEMFPGIKDFGLFDVFQRVWKTGKPESHPITVYKDNRVSGWRDNYLYKLSSGEIVAVYDDITARKQAEEKLTESKEKYSKMFHTVPTLLALSLLSNGRYIEVNDSFIDFTGYTIDEIIGKTPVELELVTNQEYRDRMKELLIEKGYFRNLEVPIQLKNGETRIGLLSGESINLGKEQYLFSTWMDITDRINAEQKVKESEEKFHALYDFAGDAIFIHDIEGKFLEVNQTAVDKYGYSKEELLQMTPIDLDTPEYAARVKERVEVLMEHGSGSFETGHVSKDGSVIPIEISSKIIDYEGKKAILSIARDITERKKIEVELRNRFKKTNIVNRIIIAGNEATNYLSFLDNVLSSTLELMNFEGGGIYIADRKAKMIEMLSEKGLPADFVEKVKKVRYDVSPRDTVMIKGQPIFTENYPKIDPENSKKWGILSLASVPLLSKEEIIGALNIASKSRYYFSEEEKDLLQYIGREIGNVISKLQAEEKLTESEGKFRIITQNIPGMVYRGNPDWSTEIITNSEVICGYSVEEFNSQKINWLDLIHPNDKEEVIKQSLKLNERPLSLSLEYRILAKDGTIHWIDDRKISLFSQDGEYNGVDGIVFDITEKKNSEYKLKESEERYRNFVQNFQGIAFQGYQDFSTAFFHGAVEEITGYFEDDFVSGKIKWDQLIHPNDILEIKERIGKFHGSSEIADKREYRIIAKDGKTRWILEYIHKFHDDKRNMDGVRGILIDNTEKKVSEDKLKESEERLHNLINNISDVLIEIDVTGKISFISSQISNIAGYQPIELIEHNIFKLAHPEDTVDTVIIKPLKDSRDVLYYEFRMKHKNGYYIPVSIKGTMVMTRGSIKIIGVLSDIAERKRVESMMKTEVKQLKDLEQIRTDLINRISHEFNTPLSSIMSGSDLLLSHYNEEIGENILEIIDIINKGGYRLKEMADNLIIAYKIESNELTLILMKKNIIPIIKDIIDDVMHQAKRRGVLLNIELLPEIAINIDESLISKAILNVLTNAIKNTPLKGNIFIKTIEHQNYVDIIVEDTGVGFTKKETPQLFSKFGKIERYGKGMDIDIEGPGLGLYISNEIVKLHKGEIIVKSKGRNKGSKFTIRLFK